jgi:hypothetical protein
MTGKSTLALLALGGAVAAWVIFFEGSQETSEEAAKARRMVLPGLKAAEVRALTITRPRDPTATAVVVRRAPESDADGGKGRWHVVLGAATATADATEVDSALSTLEFLEKKTTAPAAAAGDLGLGTPRLVVEVERASGKSALEVGDEDITGKLAWVRLAGSSGEVAAVPSYVHSRLDRRAFDFREKGLFTLDRWSASRITVTGADGKSVSFKKDGEWLMDAPETDFADRTRVEDLLGAAHGAKAKEFVAEPADAAALAAAGLAPPRFVVALEAGSEKQALEVGGRDEASKALLARKAGADAIVRIDDALAAHLVVDPEHWRSTSLLGPIRDRVEALEVRRPGEGAPLARVVREGDSGWRFAAPRTATADRDAVEGAVRAVQGLTVVATAAKRIEDAENFGLDERRALVVTLETAKEKRSFRLGKESPRENGVFVRKDGKDSALEVVFPEAGVLREAATALRDRTLVARASFDVARIDIRRKQGARSYVRLPEGGWTTPDAAADVASLETLAHDLATLRAERILRSGEDLSGTGLASPWLTASVGWTSAEEPELLLELGKVTPEGDGFHARLRHGEDVVAFALRRALVDALDREHTAAPAPAPPPAPPTSAAAPTSPAAPEPSTGTGDASGAGAGTPPPHTPPPSPPPSEAPR